jgi:uncharacterized membrane protein
LILKPETQRFILVNENLKEETYMAALTKNKIGIGIIFMVIVCLISFPGLTLTASAQPVNCQTAQTPFNPIVTNPDFILYALPSHLWVPAGLSTDTTMNATILVMSLHRFNGTVSLSASSSAGWTTSVDPSSVSLTSEYSGYFGYGSFNWSRLSVVVPHGTAAGKYTVTVTGTNGSLTHSVNVTVNVVVPDFYMLAFPSFLSVPAGSTVNSTIMVTSLYGFNGTVSLSVSPPAGWTASIVPSSLSVTSGYGGRYNWSQLSVVVPSSTAAGKYTVTVTGTNGSLTHSVNVTVNVAAPDFWVYAFPSYLWVTAGSTVNSTIMVTSLYGFNGTVSLSVTKSPPGWTTSVNPSSLSVTNEYHGRYNWSQLSIGVPSNAAVGTYTVEVTGTSGSLTHSRNVTVNVVSPDFWVSAFPWYLWATAGSTVHSTIMVTSLYGFNGNVSLTVSAPVNWTASVVPSSLSVTSGYFGYFGYGWSNWSWLSVVIPSDALAGQYTIVVTGTSGSLTHSTNVTVTVV